MLATTLDDVSIGCTAMLANTAWIEVVRPDVAVTLVVNTSIVLLRHDLEWLPLWRLPIPQRSRTV